MLFCYIKHTHFFDIDGFHFEVIVKTSWCVFIVLDTDIDMNEKVWLKIFFLKAVIGYKVKYIALEKDNLVSLLFRIATNI